MEGHVSQHDCLSNVQSYCNYPEISKGFKSLYFSSDDSTVSSIASSSILPSLNSAVSVPSSQENLYRIHKSSSSLYNVLQSSMSNRSSTSFRLQKESCLDWKFKNEYERSQSDGDLVSSSSEESVTCMETVCKIPANLPHLEVWREYANNQDPWNISYYDQSDNSITHNVRILTRQLVSASSLRIGQLPDDKSFILTRLHLNKKGLEDISILSEYRYFLYVDISWNFITDLNALGNCNYLMYLNASHNRLSAVLDFQPPWFLTHIDLSCNEIKEIGLKLCKAWSLRYIDLSYNLIEKIEGLDELRFLKYLNLSHNHIKMIENLDCLNIEHLNLEFNDISHCNLESLQALTNIKILSLAQNRLSSLQPFKQLFSLNKLTLTNNNITDLSEISCLAELKKLYELNFSGNTVCSYPSYRELVIFKIPSLKVLDLNPINSSEQVAAKMLFGPDMLTSVQQMRTKLELLNHLASQNIGNETVPFDEPKVPLIILVGTFLNKKEELAQQLAMKFPDKIYRCKKYTTIPSSKSYEPANLVSVSVDKFNLMIKNGKFFTYYSEVGFFFGICHDEICKCILESKVGLVEMPFEAAILVRLSGLHPLLVLTYVDDLDNYSDKLRNHYMGFDLWSVQDSTASEKCFPNERKSLKSTNDLSSSFENETVQSHLDETCSVGFANSELTAQTISNGTTDELKEHTIFMPQPQEQKSTTLKKSITWNLSEISRNTYDRTSIRPESLYENDTVYESDIETLCETDRGSKSNESFNLEENEESYKYFNEESTHELHSSKYYKELERQYKDTESMSILNESSSDKPNENFKWIWTYESTTTTESEPDECYLNMIEGREKFVRNTLMQQNLYIEANQLHPALFFRSVLVDDTQSALTTIKSICFGEVFKYRQTYTHYADLKQEPSCSKIVEERLLFLMKDFYNVPIEMKF